MTTPTKIAAAIALFAVTATATGTWFVRRAQLRELVRAAAAAEQVIEGWQADRAAVTDGLPSAHYRAPDVQRRAGARLRQAARVSLAALDQAAARVRRVRVTEPPNAAVDVARDAYVDHLGQWEAHLAAIAADPDLGLDVPPPQFDASRRAAARAFTAAVPPFAGGMLERRVDALLAR